MTMPRATVTQRIERLESVKKHGAPVIVYAENGAYPDGAGTCYTEAEIAVLSADRLVVVIEYVSTWPPES